jgi:hypothetical protein
MPDSPAPTIRTSTCSDDAAIAVGHPIFIRHGRTCSGHPRLCFSPDCKDVDARHKAGHDEKYVA